LAASLFLSLTVKGILKLNINNLKKVALYGGKLGDSDLGHIALTTPSRGYGFGAPPSWEDSTDFTPATAGKASPEDREFVDEPVSLAASRAMLAMLQLDAQVHAVTTDSRLSPAGRMEALKAPRANAIKTIATAGRDIAAHGATVAQRERDFYAPAKLPVGDAVSAHEDGELRAHWRTSPVAQRTKMLAQMQAGENTRMLEALTRSPIPLEAHETELVNTAWREAQAKRDPAKSSALKSARANADWSDGVVKAAARYASRSSGLSPVEIAAAAKDSGGEHLFDNIGNAAQHAA
jgi:hypothetical protein